ncbi:MAG: hypothetical protein UV67_C0002G0004 [Parcubacteria group bacterium GW2011_GWC1_43_12]|nr:MAG: hypothetical protein UV34_C0017G0003 [Parcubacteria group bacterium GW2011_GWB1_42_6]KKS92514.1 MAG: hypothetical protein UV67_C0002G0004 [Parcubacteria group bacterium GW2011_GWC1_43_12]
MKIKFVHNKSIYSFAFPIIFFAALAAFSLSCGFSRDGGIFKTFNRGETWEHKIKAANNQTISTANVLRIEIDPGDSKIIYLGTKGNSLIKTMDGGELWYSASAGNLDKRADIFDIAIDPKNSANVFLAGYQNGLGMFLRSNDAGKNWEQTYQTARELYAVLTVEIDPFESSAVYMGTAEGGFFSSSDYGKNWKAIKWFDDAVSDLKINPIDPRIMYLSTFNSGVFKSNDKGQTWQKLEESDGFWESKDIETLVMDKNNPDTLYTGSRRGFLKSYNGGQTWQKLNIIIPPESLTVQAIALDLLNPSFIYYAAGNVVYRSQDYGQTWAYNSIQTGGLINVLTIDHKDSNILYAGISREPTFGLGY